MKGDHFQAEDNEKAKQERMQKEKEFLMNLNHKETQQKIIAPEDNESST